MLWRARSDRCQNISIHLHKINLGKTLHFLFTLCELEEFESAFLVLLILNPRSKICIVKSRGYVSLKFSQVTKCEFHINSRAIILLHSLLYFQQSYAATSNYHHYFQLPYAIQFQFEARNLCSTKKFCQQSTSNIVILQHKLKVSNLDDQSSG